MILLYITDARPRYSQSLLTTAALPRGASAHYRYSLNWIDEGLLDRWRNGSLRGTSVFVCYLQGNQAALAKASARPIRAGVVRTSNISGRFGNLEVTLGDFAGGAHMGQISHLSDSDGMVSPGPREGLFVVEIGEPKGLPQSSDDIGAWQDTVAELAHMNPFKGVSFLFLEGISGPADPATILSPSEGIYRLTAGRTYELVTHSMVFSTPSPVHSYRVHHDDKVITLVDPQDLVVGRRYDLVRLMFRVSDDAHGQICLVRLSPVAGGRGTEVSVRIAVAQDKVRRLGRAAVPASAAALAATAGVIPAETPVWLRAGMVAVGSVVLGLSAKSR